MKTMKRIIFLFSMLIATLVTLAQTTTNIKLLNFKNDAASVRFLPSSPTFKNVVTPAGISQIVSINSGTPLLIEGAPDLQKLTTSIIIPDQAKMEVNIISSSYYDLAGIDIAPSKGNLMRNIDPVAVAYSYGTVYGQDDFYPAAIANLSTPHIFRDYRAQTVTLCPFQYNPITKTLRVYTDVVVSVSIESSVGGENSFTGNHSRNTIDSEFDAIYKRQFINYTAESISKAYVPVSEDGSMLIICFDSFAPDMEQFVTWKNQKGIATEMVMASLVGTTSVEIKEYITDYYSTHPSLKYVLLVGDAEQIPSSFTEHGDSDNEYGYLSGDDSYPELFIGRFSATTNAHVKIMVKRTLNYEKMPQLGADWYGKGIAIASNEGPGDDNEMDFEHQRNLIDRMMGYTYNSYSENFDGSQGGLDSTDSPSAASIGSQIDEGVGIITYTGHGSDYSFGTSEFSTTDIESLDNVIAHPFIWSVACVNGNFVANETCFAESWLRAGTVANPKGALATLMSTVNQSWNPPMEGQDEMINILVEGNLGNIKRSFGGLSMNGCMQMNDAYGADGDAMTDTWTLFGDPSVMVFTDTPSNMVTNHIGTTDIGTTSIMVSNNTENALICLSKEGTILGTGVSNGIFSEITIPSATEGVINVTATAFNKMPYFGIINVSAGVGINENSNENALMTFPNPVNATLTMNYIFNTPEKFKLALYNSLGQQVILVTDGFTLTGGFNKVIDVSSLSAGVYSCKLETENNVITKQVVIQK